MKYNTNSHIESINDVKMFFYHLVHERKLNFHPDDDFADYISYDSNTPSFTPEEVSIYNKLMEESFDACKKANEDIYNMGFKELSKGIIC